MSIQIRNIEAREVLDSRGTPTVEVDCVISSSGQDYSGRGIVPSGASTGEGEAVELRDGDAKRFLGKGVLKAVGNVNGEILKFLQSRTIKSISELDALLMDLDGTKNKSKLGANAILAVSMAMTRAMAQSSKKPLYRYIEELADGKELIMPVPLMNILNGGKHADNGLDIQEFMIVPTGFDSFHESFRAGVEVFHYLKKVLSERGLSTSVGDEGGFAPAFKGEKIHEQALDLIVRAIEKSGYRLGDQISLALDAAASEYSKKAGTSSAVYNFEGKTISSDEMISVYATWLKRYPILSIEDGLSEHDWTGWKILTEKMGSQCQLVGDDLFVTNPEYLARGIKEGIANSILIKLNQIGTVTETLAAMKMARESKFRQIVSHRSGETEDTFIADLAVGTACGQIKTGSASRTDRVAKYNQLLRIEKESGKNARFLGRSAFTL